MVSHDLIGHRLPVTLATVEPGRLRSFRRTIGYADEAAESAPLTYLFALEMLDADRPLAFIEDLGIPMPNVLHSEQAFDYFQPVTAGDRLKIEGEVSDIFDKKDGALSFVVQDIRVSRADDGQRVANLRRTLVVRNG